MEASIDTQNQQCWHHTQLTGNSRSVYLPLKLHLYKMLIWLRLEHAVSAMNPYLGYLTESLEPVQNKSAPFVLSNYHSTTSATTMTLPLSLPNLALHWHYSGLCLFYNIRHHSCTLFHLERHPHHVRALCCHVYYRNARSFNTEQGGLAP